jgi:hypothetical protein
VTGMSHSTKGCWVAGVRVCLCAVHRRCGIGSAGRGSTATWQGQKSICRRFVHPYTPRQYLKSDMLTVPDVQMQLANAECVAMT